MVPAPLINPFFFFCNKFKTLKRLFFLIAIFLFAFAFLFSHCSNIYIIFVLLPLYHDYYYGQGHHPLTRRLFIFFFFLPSPFTVYDAYRREPSQIFFGGVLISVQARVALFYWRILWGELLSLILPANIWCWRPMMHITHATFLATFRTLVIQPSDTISTQVTRRGEQYEDVLASQKAMCVLYQCLRVKIAPPQLPRSTL